MRAAFLGLVLLGACAPLTPPPDGGTQADSGGGVDAGDPDAWPCDGGPCAVEDVVFHHALPLEVLPLGDFVYWSEFGSDNRGIHGTIRRLSRATRCLDPDAGCGTPLSQSLLANTAPQWLVSDGADLCWIAYYWDRSNVYCFNLERGSARPIGGETAYPTSLVLLGGEVAWARLNVPASATNGALIARARDGGAERIIIGGRGHVLSLAVADGGLVWSEEVDGGSALSTLAPDGGVARWVTATGRMLGLTASGGWVYFANYDTGEIGRWAPGATRTESLALAERHPEGVAVEPPWVYWLAFGTLPDGPDGALRGVRPDGGEVRTFATGLASVNQFTVENGWAWWAAQGTSSGNFEDGAIQRVRVR